MLYATVSVAEVRDVGPHLRRVTLEGDGLAGFRTIAPDQQVKLFFARDGGVPELPGTPKDMSEVADWYARYLAMPDEVRPWMRTYSIRRAMPDERRVEIDFVLHADSAGPASAWAAAAAPGDVIGLLGPAQSRYREPQPGDPLLLAGDETALPAIAAWLESLHADDRASVHIEVSGPDDEQDMVSTADVTVHWHHRGDAAPGTSDVLLDGVRAAAPAPPLFAWVAGEASAVRALRRHLVGECGLDKRAVAFTGYWRRRMTQDDAPTAEDAADAAEIMADLETQGA
ncbi:siderophore-interacting protein [Pseudonocardia endophytica]|uniref:NADPH-dependent ferric siderophore reductase n=1 Tax=Pseudonocardia endophytica TaxID=401976 RepID=A0A4R1HKG7_PSEEN|nr:siderophore-interacting protein [Pseudonocardia endophytica]TCK21541.1 NADPH-dependent ferric siderophore reductase [Pseudonocardia endophytica]